MLTPIALRNNAITTAREVLAHPDRYLVLDTETAGLGNRAEILELAILSPSKETLYHQYFQPQIEIAPRAAAVHGLTLAALRDRGAISWADAHGDISRLLAGKILLAYNAPFDVGALHTTATLHGLKITNSLDSLCVMRLYQRFKGSAKRQRLEGDHTAVGDCMAAIALLEEMAAAELEDDPEAIVPESAEEVARLYAEMDELNAQIRPLQARVDTLKRQVSNYLLHHNLQEVAIDTDKKLKLQMGAKDLKPIGDPDELPDRLKKVSIDRKAAQQETENWTAESPYFTYTPSASFRQVKQ